MPSWSIQPFGHNRHGPKIAEGAPPSFWGGKAGCFCTTKSPGPRPTSIPSCILIHPAIWPQQIWAENWGLWPFGEGKLGPHLTQCGQGRGLPGCQVSSYPSNRLGTIQNTPTLHTGQTDRTDIQRSDSIGRTVLQTVAQKLESQSYSQRRLLDDVLVVLIQYTIIPVWLSYRRTPWHSIYRAMRARCTCFEQKTSYVQYARNKITIVDATIKSRLYKKLIGRWHSERELFYDDIVHVEASAIELTSYFLLSIYATYLPIKPIFNVDSPVQPAVLYSGPAHCYKNSSGNMGVGNYSLKWRPLPPVVLPK